MEVLTMIDSNAPQEWCPVIGLEDLYEVSEYGYVRRRKPGKNRKAGHVLALNRDKYGYLRVQMWHTEKRVMVTAAVQRLVMRAFVGERPEGQEVNHIDGDKSNNHVSNLEYVTHKENIVHSFQVLKRHVPRGEETGSAKLKEFQVIEIRKRAAAGETYRAIAGDYNVSHVTITQIVLRRTWTHIEAAS
jgi:hypothetical protein